MAAPKKSTENPLGLPPFQGCAITAVAVTISNAGGGLHEPLAIDPQMAAEVAGVTIGDTRYFLIRGDCNGVSHKPVKGAEDKLQYVPSFHATDTVMIDDEWAVEAINKERDRIAELKDAAAQIPGQGKLAAVPDDTGSAS